MQLRERYDTPISSREGKPIVDRVLLTREANREVHILLAFFDITIQTVGWLNRSQLNPINMMCQYVRRHTV
jgi:hypothetical protein